MLPDRVQITEGGGLVWQGAACIRERNRIYDLKANILKIKRTELRRFFAFAEILSAMDADQLGDFIESKNDGFTRLLSSEWHF